MKILIIGGRGFIGTALHRRVKHLRSDARILDLPKVDLRKPVSFRKIVVREKPDVVINLGAILGTMKESPDIKSLFETNVIGNLNALEVARDAGVTTFVFASSMTVHGENARGDHRTRFSPFNPKHGYSASKAAAEFSMMQFIHEAPDMRIVTVRPTMVLGKGTYLPHAPIEFIKTVLAGNDIEIYGDGLHEREWIWIDDVADGFIKAAEFGLKAQPGYYPFFLSAGRISMCDLARKVARKLGGKVVFTPSTKQAFTLTADSRESRRLLGWQPRITIDGMIDALITLHKNEKK